MADAIKFSLERYLKDKPYQHYLTAWKIMEAMQDEHPYAEFGWDGFMIFLFYRMGC